MEVEFDGEEEDEPCCLCLSLPCNCSPPRNCHGNVEIRSELNGIERVHGKFVKEERDFFPLKVKKMRYIPRMERASTKFIQVNGNCCWKFYNR